MAFTSYGSGAWGLPEFGLTEKLGGNKSSVRRAQAVVDSSANIPISQPLNKPLGTVQGVSTAKPVSSSKPISYKSSSTTSGSGTDGEEAIRRQMQKEVDRTYGGIFDYISKMRSSLEASKPNLLSIAASPYDAAVPMVNNALAEGQQAYEGAKGEAVKQGENALTAARNLFNELSSRNRQLFGGVTNVGQAAGELLGRQQMTQTGNIRQGVTNQLQDYTVKAQQLKEKADAQLQQLEMQKRSAIQQAELEFRDRLQQLDQLEVDTRRNKSVEKLNTLRSYLARVQQLNDEARQIEYNIKASAAQNASALGGVTEDWQNTPNQINDYSGDIQNQFDEQYASDNYDMQGANSLSGPALTDASQYPYQLASPVRRPEDQYATNPFIDAQQMANVGYPA